MVSSAPDAKASESTAGTRCRIWSAAHDGAATRFRAAAGPRRPAESAHLVVAVAPGAAAPAPDRVSANPAAVRPRPQGGDAGAHTVVADAAAPRAGGTRDHRRGGAALEPADRHVAGERADGAADR